jgi:hypothetical protein
LTQEHCPLISIDPGQRAAVARCFVFGNHAPPFQGIVADKAFMIRVKSPQDFGAAILFLVIGIAGIYFGRDLAFGSSSRMGPGYFPTILSCLIVLIGAIVGLRSLTIEGPPIEPVGLRPLLFILAAILAFGYLIEQIGLAITTIGLTIFAAYARHDVNLKETIVLAVVLAAFAIGVFAYALGQPLPIWWGT